MNTAKKIVFGTRRRGFLLSALTLIAVTLLSACGGGSAGGDVGNAGGDGGGISGTGFNTVVTGKVTGFGSVVIGGIHYQAKAGATVRVEGKTAATEADLQPGMIVVLKGTFDSASTAGTYNSISYRADLEGPAAEVDLPGGLFTLLGQTVLVDAATLFDGLPDLSALPNGTVVQVSGTFDSLGRLHATRVLLVKRTIAPADSVKLKGRVGSIGTASFTIGNQQVAFSSSQTTFANLTPGDLSAADNRLLEVTGNVSGSIVNATRIERLDANSGAVPGDRIDISGFIVSGDATSFVLNSANGPLTIAGGSATIKNGTPAAILPGREVEVAGTLNGGVLLAAVIELEQDNTVKLEGDVTAVDRIGKSVTLNGINVVITGQTAFKDASDADVRAFSLVNIVPGDHLEIGGFLDSSVAPAGVVASKLERLNPKAVTIIRGPVSQLSPQLAILGVPILTTADTSFTKGGIDLGSFAAFSAEVTLGSTVVMAKGSFSPSTAQLSATELEIQQ